MQLTATLPATSSAMIANLVGISISPDELSDRLCDDDDDDFVEEDLYVDDDEDFDQLFQLLPELFIVGFDYGFLDDDEAVEELKKEPWLLEGDPGWLVDLYIEEALAHGFVDEADCEALLLLLNQDP